MNRHNFSNFTFFLILLLVVFFIAAAIFLAFLLAPARLVWPD